MTEREWKPGDVAMRRSADRHGDLGYEKVTIATTCRTHADGRDLHWHHVGGGWDPLHEEDGPTYRPLVVIDPESDADVARLENALEDQGCRVGTGVRAALREFANPTPPKPDEPQGLGAVVEDDGGGLWIRTAEPRFPWRIDYEGGNGAESTVWEHVAAVRVLPEGVS